MRCSRRKRRGTAIKSGAHRRQSLAPDTAAIAQNGAPALRRVPAQEAVLTFAANFRWLILAFHKALPLRGVRFGASLPEKRATLSVKGGVSTLRVNSKSQKPNFEASKLRHQWTHHRRSHGPFGIWNLFGVWALGFFPHSNSALAKRTLLSNFPVPAPRQSGGATENI